MSFVKKPDQIDKENAHFGVSAMGLLVDTMLHHRNEAITFQAMF